MIKFVVAILAVISVVLAESDEAILGTDAEKNQCIKELKMDASKIHDIDVENMDKMTHDEKCLLKCMLEKEGAIDAKVNLILDESDERIEKDLGVDFSKCILDESDERIEKDLGVDFSKCTPQQSITDLCERAFVLTKCALELVMGATTKKS
ncbi:PBP/GOBP family [Popillia japonica]|uniref:PBP/GOBP family n=1 Tax=Popillia japonica TaxID=7064 RepID=A0AAW1MIG4_POPJA